MNWKLFTEYSAWLIPLCLLLGAVYASVLYYREEKNEFSRRLKSGLALLRLITVSLIAFLLLSPFVQIIHRAKENPVIILAQDNSRSILTNPDSNFYRGDYLSDLDRLSNQLGGVGEVAAYVFGDKATRLESGKTFSEATDFNAQQTDLSGLLEELALVYANRNVGALVIASDGIYNSGTNPVHALRSWPFPVYTLALGDTTQRKDLFITRINYNRTVFLNNQYPVEIDIHAHDCQGEKTAARIFSGDQLVFSQEVQITGPNQDLTVKALLEAKETGLKKLRISLDPLEAELSRQNNIREIFIEVLEARFRILMLARAPHPDVTALRQAILSNANYEVSYQQPEKFTGPVDQYNLVILHDLPSADQPVQQVLEEMGQKKVPGLFIIGDQMDLPRFNGLKSGLNIITGKKLTGEAVAEFNDDFVLFSLSEESKRAIRDFPPLFAPLGDYQANQGLNTLMTQRIGAVSTSKPLLAFSETDGIRQGILCGEGIWRWRLQDFARNQDHLAFNELFNKVLQYLSVREVKKNLRIYYQANFKENERVIFDAEVYDEAYELTTVPDLEMVITGEAQDRYPFVFTRIANAYRLDAGILAPGNYRYQATAKAGELLFESSGQFSISRLDLELSQTVADHSLMFSLAKAGDGEMFMPSETGLLLDALKERSDIRPLIYSQKRFSELIDYVWILALIIFLASLEWFLRKRAGGY